VCGTPITTTISITCAASCCATSPMTSASSMKSKTTRRPARTNKPKAPASGGRTMQSATNKTPDKSRANGRAPGQHTYSAKHVTVYALEGSYAARRAPLELHEAEKAVEALEKLLDPPAGKRNAKVEVYLTDPLVDLASDDGRWTMDD